MFESITAGSKLVNACSFQRPLWDFRQIQQGLSADRCPLFPESNGAGAELGALCLALRP
jgi:hypothetical protein